MPSSLAIAGIEKPKHVEFHDIIPLAKGETESSPYKEIYGAYLNIQRSITVDNYKLIAYPSVPKIRVYNLENDPHEKNDLASNPSGKKIIQRLLPRLVKLQKEMGDSLDLVQSFPEFKSK